MAFTESVPGRGADAYSRVTRLVLSFLRLDPPKMVVLRVASLKHAICRFLFTFDHEKLSRVPLAWKEKLFGWERKR